MRNKFFAALTISVLLFVCLIAVSCGAKSSFVISAGQGVSLSAVNSMGWLDENRFISISEDGIARIWNIFSGYPAEIKQNEAGGFPDYHAALSNVFPLTSGDGTKKIFPSGDSSIILADSSSGKELARYYGLSNGEWLCVNSEGFYNSSLKGSSFLYMHIADQERRFRMDELSGALFRPDLFKNGVLSGKNSGKRKTPVTLPRLLKDTPPELSVSMDRSALSSGELKIIVTEGKGGTGFLASYRLQGEEEIPEGLYDIKTASDRKYKKNGNTCYEIKMKTGLSLTGLSVFNKNNTVESERHWVILPEVTKKESAAAPPPELRVLTAGTGKGAALGNFFSAQENGGFFKAIEVINLSGEEFTRPNFTSAFETLCVDAGKNDVIIIYLEGNLQTDLFGNLQIAAGKAKSETIYGDDLLKLITGLSQNSILLFDLANNDSEDSNGEIDTALRRFRHRLGPKAILAGNSILDAVTGSFGEGFGSRYTSAASLLSRTSETLNEQGSAFLAFYPAKDFHLTDPLFNAGELKFQTMASGMLKIDKVDSSPVPLNFGNTMVRTLPPGSYIIDMVYRNGYRETRLVDLKVKESKWVIFNYTPGLLDGSTLRSLVSRGINIAELNPANYEKVNKEAMEGMGMAPYYVAFLAGEKFYREGKYREAITEYNRTISLNSGYAQAYVSRGNAQRRNGNYDRAIEDYSRAISLNSAQAEVYNYRGFAYSQKGELDRAITDYTQAIRANANYADAYFNRAHAYGRQSRWDAAIADYTQVIKIEPSNSAAYNARGNAWKSSGNDDRAEADFAAAARLKR